MFGFSVDNIISASTTVMKLVSLRCYHATMALLIFENLFCLPSKTLHFETSLFP